jgi:hypothetical protein
MQKLYKFRLTFKNKDIYKFTNNLRFMKKYKILEIKIKSQI